MSASDFWDLLPLGPGVKVIKSDSNGLAALEKPSGVRSHPNEPGSDSKSLLTCPYDFKTESFSWTGPTAPGQLWLLNRLDAATSGIVLVASNSALAAAIKLQFAKKTISKIYLALVFGKAPSGSQVWRDKLAIDKRGGQIRTKAVGNIPAESDYQFLKSTVGVGRLNLIRLEPKTGRSHQLRVQCARRGLPIVGDATYGDFKANREFSRVHKTKRLFLHSAETVFSYSIGDREFSFRAKSEMPSEFSGSMREG